MTTRTSIRPTPRFAANRERMQQLVAELREWTKIVRMGGGSKYLERHREQGKLPVRERIELLLDPGSPFLELSALAAFEMYDNEAPAAGLVTGIGRVSGREVLDRRQRRDGEGRHLLPDHGQETCPRAAGGAREPPAVRLPGRLRRRVPAAPGRGLSRSRALRPDLLQPGPHVGRADSADRRGHGIVHGRRRVRAGDVGRNDHRQRHGHDLSGRPAAGEGGHRRGSHGRGARRRRRPHPPLRRRRLLRGRRRARADDVPDDRLDAQHGQAPARRT